MRRFVLSALLMLSATHAYSWGETGHDTIARVAVRLLAERVPDAFAKPFLMKEHMIGHLANVPDIVWRSEDKRVTSFNSPTHYVDFEFMQANPSTITPTALPHELKAYVEAIRANCHTSKENCAPGKSDQQKLSKTGTAPLRVGQLARLMRAAMAEAKVVSDKKSKGEDSPFDGRVNAALLYGGLMAHFVGDLTMPLHTSKDYDGWDHDAGGLHEYFESDMVNAQDLSLVQEVFIQARDGHLFEKAEAKYVPKAADRRDAVTSAWVLVADSQSEVQPLFDLDKKVSRLQDSKAGSKIRARRRDPRETRDAYKAMIVQRLALGADALATIWIREWEEAGKPDLSGYFSFAYPVKPDFVEPVEAVTKLK